MSAAGQQQWGVARSLVLRPIMHCVTCCAVPVSLTDALPAETQHNSPHNACWGRSSEQRKCFLLSKVLGCVANAAS